MARRNVPSNPARPAIADYVSGAIVALCNIAADTIIRLIYAIAVFVVTYGATSTFLS